MPTARFVTLWNSNETRLRRLTAETEAFRAGRPFDPLQYVGLVNRLNVYPAVTLWNLTLAEFSQLIGGPLQLAKRAQIQAKFMEPVDEGRAGDLVNKTKIMLLALDALVQGSYAIRSVTGLGNVRGIPGLGVVGVDDAAAISTGTVVAVGVSAVLIVATLAAAQVVSVTLTLATTFCIARGCSVQELQSVIGAMTDAAVRIIETNPLNKIASPSGEGIGNLIFWGGLLAVGSAVAYGIWKAEGSPVPGRVSRALNGLSEGEFESDSARLKKMIRQGPREDEYIDTSEYDDLLENEAPASAAKAEAPSRRRTSSGEGRLVASYPLRKGVRPAADMDMSAWKIACRALGMKASEGAGCTKPEMVIDETCTQARKIVFGQDMSPSDRDKVARALRGGGYKVEID